MLAFVIFLLFSLKKSLLSQYQMERTLER